MLNFKPAFSLSSSLWSRDSLLPLHFLIRVVSSAYLRLLIFLPAILIPARASSSLAFRMMYSAYKLNKHGDIIFTKSPFRDVEVVYISVISVWDSWFFRIPTNTVYYHSPSIANIGIIALLDTFKVLFVSGVVSLFVSSVLKSGSFWIVLLFLSWNLKLTLLYYETSNVMQVINQTLITFQKCLSGLFWVT